MSHGPRIERLPVGQLLGNLVRLFRLELAVRGDASDGFEGIRPAHLPVFGSIKAGGSRLTDLASASSLSLSSVAELVDGLEQLDYLERTPDPSDRRAKLISLTERGWQAIHEGRRLIAEIEASWADALGGDDFESLCRDLQRLLDVLDPAVRAQYVD